MVNKNIMEGTECVGREGRTIECQRPWCGFVVILGCNRKVWHRGLCCDSKSNQFVTPFTTIEIYLGSLLDCVL